MTASGAVIPPKANADVVVPVPAILRLAIVMLSNADQLVPLYSSVQVTTVGVPPPIANVAV